jgi:hypothetical protein
MKQFDFKGKAETLAGLITGGALAFIFGMGVETLIFAMKGI